MTTHDEVTEEEARANHIAEIRRRDECARVGRWLDVLSRCTNLAKVLKHLPDDHIISNNAQRWSARKLWDALAGTDEGEEELARPLYPSVRPGPDGSELVSYQTITDGMVDSGEARWTVRIP